MKLINYLSKQSVPDKIISIIIIAFLSASIPLALGIFNMMVFIASLSLVAILLFSTHLGRCIKSIPASPEGTAGLGFAIGMIGLIILLFVIILNR